MGKVHFTAAVHQLLRLCLNCCAYDRPSPRSVLIVWIATVTYWDDNMWTASHRCPETTAKCMWANYMCPTFKIYSGCGSVIASCYMFLKNAISHLRRETSPCFCGHDIRSSFGLYVLYHWEHMQIKLSLPWGRWTKGFAVAYMSSYIKHPVCLCHASLVFDSNMQSRI